MKSIPNILADRYASKSMAHIWSTEHKIVLERELWIAVMRAQKKAGIDIPQDAINAYEKAVDNVDLEAIRAIERVTKHDVKARIDAFCQLAGHEHIHKGMTSRDLTENVEQLQIYASLKLIRMKAAATLGRFSEKAQAFKTLPLTARTHNVPAQLTTLGKRFAMFAEPLLSALKHLEGVISGYRFRGLKGAVGTQRDLITLFGSQAAAAACERDVLNEMNIPAVYDHAGQTYPRSLDFKVVSLLLELASGPSDFAMTLRLMAGQGLAHEGFAKGQVGSSAMPHKVNCRSSERICGLKTILSGYVTMASGLAGNQWNEGDVSCSVVRRVLFPDAFLAADGLFETCLTVLDQLVINDKKITQEVEKTLPFLLTGNFLMEATKTGLGREKAHELIKEHAIAASNNSEISFREKLADDPALGLSTEKIESIIKKSTSDIVSTQPIDMLSDNISHFLKQYPEAASYQPDPIL